jgi:hypothetical protein
MIHAPAEFQSAFTSKWEPLTQGDEQDDSFDAWLTAGKDRNRFESVVRRQPPAMLTITDDTQVRKFMTRCQGNPQVTILSCPKVTTHNGQACRVEVGQRSPFVVGLKPVGDAVEPQIRVVEAGLKLRLRATGQTSGQVKLNLGFAQTEVRKVDVASYPLGKVQIPEVAEGRMQAIATVQPGESVVLRGLESTSDQGKKTEPLWVMVRVVRIDEPQPTAKSTPGKPERDQSAAEHPAPVAE